MRGMQNFVLALIVFAGAFIGASQGMTFASIGPWVVGAALVAGIVKAVLFGPFPKQFWGPGTIPPRHQQPGLRRDSAEG